MAKLLYLRNGPAGQNVTKSQVLDVNSLVSFVGDRSVVYSETLPVINPDSFNPVSGPSHVVIEILPDEKGAEPFDRVGFYIVKDTSPTQVKKMHHLGGSV